MCILCDKGKFCNESGLTNPSGPCTAGWYCQQGSKNAKPKLCKAGHFCDEGAEFEKPCPKGTYSMKEGLKNKSDCDACIEGFYCDEDGLTFPNKVCPKQYFCPNGSSNGRENGCPQQHFCPGNSSEGWIAHVDQLFTNPVPIFIANE